MPCSEQQLIFVAAGQAATVCIEAPTGIQSASFDAVSYGVLAATRLQPGQNGGYFADLAEASPDEPWCFDYVPHSVIGCSSATETLQYSLHGHSGATVACELAVSVQQVPSQFSIQAADELHVFSSTDILVPLVVTATNMSPLAPQRFIATLSVNRGLLSVVAEGFTSLPGAGSAVDSATTAPPGVATGTPLLTMEGSLVDINRRLALLYYHQPRATLSPSGSDTLHVQLDSLQNGRRRVAQRVVSVKPVLHPQVQSVRFSATGAQLEVKTRGPISQPSPGAVPCEAIFTTDSVQRLGAVSCSISGDAVVATLSSLGIIKPGDEVTIKPGGLAVDGQDAHGTLPISNSLAPEACGATITQATASLCSGVTSLVRSVDNEVREPRFIWAADGGPCALQSYLSGVSTREIRAPARLLNAEAASFDLEAVCVTFTGQYGRLDRTEVMVVPDNAPRSRILTPDVVKGIAGFKMGVIGSVTQAALTSSDGCTEVTYVQLESRCCSLPAVSLFTTVLSSPPSCCHASASQLALSLLLWPDLVVLPLASATRSLLSALSCHWLAARTLARSGMILCNT